MRPAKAFQTVVVHLVPTRDAIMALGRADTAKK
jgi:hypothetical protein